MLNIIAVPCYYLGTSFEEIVGHMIVATKSLNFPIRFVGLNKPLKNNLKDFLLDDEHYIKSQLNLIGELIKIKKPAKILFLDFFNPGLDLLKYHHEQKNIKMKYGALLHGCTFFNHDIYNQTWLRSFEFAWAKIYDIIYVASFYAKNNLPKQIRIKSKVLPWGLDNFHHTISTNKKYDVIFPHRLSPDKGIKDLIKIVKSLPMIKFVLTIPQVKHITQYNPYYKELKRYHNVKFISGANQRKHNLILPQARIVLSCAKQETFGYSVMKSVLSGCIPVLPNSQCYPEFFKKNYLYQTLTEAREMIQNHISRKKDTIDNKQIFLKPNHINRLSFVSHFQNFFQK